MWVRGQVTSGQRPGGHPTYFFLCDSNTIQSATVTNGYTCNVWRPVQLLLDIKCRHGMKWSCMTTTNVGHVNLCLFCIFSPLIINIPGQTFWDDWILTIQWDTECFQPPHLKEGNQYHNSMFIKGSQNEVLLLSLRSMECSGSLQRKDAHLYEIFILCCCTTSWDLPEFPQCDRAKMRFLQITAKGTEEKSFTMLDVVELRTSSYYRAILASSRSL